MSTTSEPSGVPPSRADADTGGEAGRAILLVEDDERLAALVREYLEGYGFSVRLEPRGDRAAERILAEPPDLVILDIMLPGIDGLEVCRRVRPAFRGPILILTARGDETDEIVGIEVGADDYLAKPVRPRLLLARVSALLRRAAWSSPAGGELAAPGGQAPPDHPSGAGVPAPPDRAPPPIDVGALSVRPADRQVALAGAPVELTTAEFDLLYLLASRAGTVVTRDEIYQRLRGMPYDGLDRSMDLRVARLRRKLGDDAKQPRIIKTVRGVGYLLVTSP